MEDFFIVNYLIDGLKFRVVVPFHEDITEEELLSSANKEVEKRGYQEYELLDWR